MPHPYSGPFLTNSKNNKKYLVLLPPGIHQSYFFKYGWAHRYLRKVDYSRYISLQKSTSTRTNASSRPKTRLMGRQGRQVGSIDVPTLTVYTFAAANNRTNIHNKRGSTCNWSVQFLRCLWRSPYDSMVECKKINNSNKMLLGSFPSLGKLKKSFVNKFLNFWMNQSTSQL